MGSQSAAFPLENEPFHALSLPHSLPSRLIGSVLCTHFAHSAHKYSLSLSLRSAWFFVLAALCLPLFVCCSKARVTHRSLLCVCVSASIATLIYGPVVVLVCSFSFQLQLFFR